MTGGGARPNLFEANIIYPSQALQGVTNATTNAQNGGTGGERVDWDPNAQDEFQFLCKATSMPTQTIGSVDVPFRGRILKVAGDRTFEPWSVTVINDESFDLRESFERWQELINGIASGSGAVTPSEYMGSGTIRQLGRTDIGTREVNDTKNGVLYTYNVQDIWPSEIGSIDLSYESSDAIEEFTVTFQVQYMEILGASTQTNI